MQRVRSFLKSALRLALAGRRLRPATWAPSLAVAVLASLLPAVPAAAQGTFDVLVATSGQKLLVGFHSHTLGKVAGAVHGGTGLKLHRADFGDFPGGPRATDDPGFQAFAGTLPAGQLVYARGEGVLQYWGGPGTSWGAPPGGEVVRLFGGVPTDIAIAHLYCSVGDPVLCNPGLAAQYPFYEQGTAFSATGITGPNPAIIDAASAQGSFHAHLDWFIEGQSGALPATGAYLVTLRLSTDGGPLADSNPFHVLFNHGLSPSAFASAVPLRMVGFAIDQPAVVPLPGGAVLGLSGLLLLWLAGGRVRSAPRSRPRSSGPVPG